MDLDIGFIKASGLQVTIDYLEFTIPIPYDEEEVSEMSVSDMLSLSETSMHEVVDYVLCMNLEDFTQLPSGRNGYLYQKKWVCGNLFVLYGAEPRQGIHVILSGKGCRAYNTAVGSLMDLARNVMDFGGKITRCDFAVDDERSKYFTVSDVLHRFQNNEVVTRWHAVNVDFKINHAQVTEKECLYFGSMKSDCFLRIYNKTLEQMVQDNAKRDDFVKADRSNMWTRWEFVLRRENAHNAIVQYINGMELGKLFAGIMANYFRIVKNDGFDSNKRRWEVDSKWLEFMGAVEPLRLKVYKDKKDIESAKRWVKDQISPTLAAIMQFDDGFEWLQQIIIAAQSRISPAMRVAVEEGRAKKEKAKIDHDNDQS